MFYIFAVALAAVNFNGQGLVNAQDLPQNNWSRILTPSKGEPNSIGFYSNGCIAGAKSLPLSGTGYQVMRVFRNRFYGHSETLEFVQQLGRTMDALGSAVLIGDIGQPRGGILPYGHTSHQMGLDVDVWFWTHPEQRVRELTDQERNNLPFVDMLNANGVVDPEKFTQDQITKLKASAANPLVERIFVNPSIKVYLCSILDEKDMDWLHKLRPWPGHNEHFHVRLKCPVDSSQCTPQAPVADGNGCSEVLPPRGKGYEAGHTTEEETDDHALEQFFNSMDAPAPIPAACSRLLKEKQM